MSARITFFLDDTQVSSTYAGTVAEALEGLTERMRNYPDGFESILSTDGKEGSIVSYRHVKTVSIRGVADGG